MSKPRPSLVPLPRFVLLALLYNVAVIVWGAFVRASKSGAGCGSHWPSCNGEIIPTNPKLETVIEYAHRLSSGLCLVLAIVLAVWIRRAFAPGHPARRAGLAVLYFTISEALVGAGLVLFEWVAHDRSLGRVLSMALHLTNTLLLLAALALTYLRVREPSRPSFLLKSSPAASSRVRWLSLGALIGAFFVGATGAIAALGDTLFQASSLAEGIRQDFSVQAHWIVRLRILHPFIAAAYGAYLIYYAAAAQKAQDTVRMTRYSSWVIGAVLLQWSIGVFNLLWLAPVPLQLLHLASADLLWILTVWLVAEWMAPAPAPSQGLTL